jgi:hypothetical protein
LLDRAKLELRRDSIRMNKEQQELAIALGSLDPETGVWRGHAGDMAAALDLAGRACIATVMQQEQRLAAGELRVPVPMPGTDMSRLLAANVLMRRELEKLRIAIQNDAPFGCRFEGVFVDKDDRPHLGYRRPDSKEVISPFHLDAIPGADPQLSELIYFYKDDGEDPDEVGDQLHVGLVMYEGDYMALEEQRILPKYAPLKASDREALRAAYDEFALNTKFMTEHSTIGRQRTLLANLLRGWGIEVES